MSDGCRPTSQQSSSQPSSPTTDTLHARATLETVRGSGWTTARPGVPERTAAHNTSSMLMESTQGGARQSTADPATTPRPVSPAALPPATADVDSTLNATTVAPEFPLDTITPAGAFKSPHNYTRLDNRTAPTSFADSTAPHNVATDGSVSPNNMHSIATASSQREQLTDVITMSNTTGTTAGGNQTRKGYLTTVTSPSNPVYFSTTATTETDKRENGFTVDNRNHHNQTNTSPNAAEYSRTTVTPPGNNATESAFSVDTADVDGNPHNDTTSSTSTPSIHTTSYNYLAQRNMTDSSKTYNNTFITNYNTTDASSYTAEFNNTTGATVTAKPTTGTFMLPPDYTNMNSNATVSASSMNTTTASPNETVTGGFATSASSETQQVALPTSGSDVSTASNAAAVTQTSAQSGVPLNTLTTPTPHSVTSSSHGYTTADTVASLGAAGSATANVSQTPTKDPAVTSSATTGNPGLSATDASNTRGPQSAEISVTGAQEEQASKLLDQTRDVSQLNSSQVKLMIEM